MTPAGGGCPFRLLHIEASRRPRRLPSTPPDPRVRQRL